MHKLFFHTLIDFIYLENSHNGAFVLICFVLWEKTALTFLDVCFCFAVQFR